MTHSPKRYLVTGGCGFIGSHLVDALIADGHFVTILDDLSTGKRENAHSSATVIVGDATNYETVERAFTDIDGCFHLAAVASVEKSIKEWAKTHTVNITATVNVFQASSCRSKPVPVVYTSSASVYGDCLIMPLSEEAPTRPLTAYGADKLGCDLHGEVACRVHGVPTLGLRPFNVYGPRQDPSSPYSGVISIFTDRVQQGLPITIFGDGEQVRDFVYVGDAVKAFKGAMAYLEAQPEPVHEIINLCTGRGTSINHLSAIIAAIANISFHRNYAPARKGDIRFSIGNPAKLTERLGVQLNTTLPEGLHTLIEAPEKKTKTSTANRINENYTRAASRLIPLPT
jgi:UDP-glucose 4-epimerase